MILNRDPRRRRTADVEELLTSAPPAPPADLLARLRADIPPEVELSPEARERLRRELRTVAQGSDAWPASTLRHAMLAAASVALIATVVGLAVIRHDGETRQQAAREERARVATEPLAVLQSTAEEETSAVSAPAGATADAGAAMKDEEVVFDKELGDGGATPAMAPRRAAPPAALRRQAAPEELPRRRASDAVSAVAPVEAREPVPSPPPPASARRSRASRLEAGVEGAVAGGSPGGVVGGVLGGIPGGTQPAPAPSIGGSAEPNDAPYGDMFFAGHGTNPFIDTEDDRLSTFGLDVDTGAFNVVRRYLDEGHLPPTDAVRVEELLNHFRYGDPPPAAGRGDFALAAEGAPSPFGEGPAAGRDPASRYYLLRLNVTAREIAAAQRAPADLVFTVDVSGSMAQQNRLELVKSALDLLLTELRPDDRVGLVIYGSRGEVVLEPTGDRGLVRQALRRLQPGGATNAEEGLVLAYELAARTRRPGAIHRVVLLSDGVANVGATGPASILARLREAAAQGIELTTVGVGMGNYNDALMEQLADAGNGRYAYVDDLGEARRVFVEELTGTLQTVAAEARAQVEFEPRLVSRYRLLGYENRDIADERFRDDTVDAGEIGAGHSVTALYELKLARAPRPGDRLATLRLRWASVAAGEMRETEQVVRGADVASSWQRAPARLRLSSLVAELGELLRGSVWARRGSFDEVVRRAEVLAAERPADPAVAELLELARSARRAAQAASAASGE